MLFKSAFDPGTNLSRRSPFRLAKTCGIGPLPWQMITHEHIIQPYNAIDERTETILELSKGPSETVVLNGNTGHRSNRCFFSALFRYTYSLVDLS